MRLDKYLVSEGHFESRNRALEAIRSGAVSVDGKQPKASQAVSENNKIEITVEKFYVSRAARKLEALLQEYPLRIQGRRALDIGSSTGGFAQILLEQEVASLHCVDVGSDQLHHSLRSDPRLSLHEETDIRAFDSPEPFGLITCDVSFISVLQIIEAIDRLSREDTDIIILYKPQFEVGKGVKRDSRGVVTDTAAIAEKQEQFIATTQRLKWILRHQTPSRITGKEGNQEHMFHFTGSET